eukprot:gene25851-34436_t
MFVLSLIIAVWVSGVNSTAFNNVAILRRIKTTFCSIGVSSAIVGASIIDFAGFAPAHASEYNSIEIAGDTLQNQLKSLQQQKVLNQRQALQEKEQTLLTKALQYPEGRLIARGVIILSPQQSEPYGFTSAGDLDPAFTSDTASLFILGVGREGPPLAAKRIPLKNLEFPLVFELKSDTDLLFPYTEEAWVQSTNAKDSIATTVILSSSNALSQPANNERYGFALSDPMTFAGVLTRSSATIGINGKIDSNLYTKEEIALLAGVDKELEAKLTTVLSEKKNN